MVDELLLKKLELSAGYRTYKKKYQIKTLCANIGNLLLLILVIVGGLTGRIGHGLTLIGAAILCVFAFVLFLATMQAFGRPKYVMEGTVSAIKTRSEPTVRSKKRDGDNTRETASYFIYQITGPDGSMWAKDACPELSSLRCDAPAIYFDMGLGNRYAVGNVGDFFN